MRIVPPASRYALITALLVPLALAACEDEGDLGEAGVETGETVEEAVEDAEEQAD